MKADHNLDERGFVALLLALIVVHFRQVNL